MKVLVHNMLELREVKKENISCSKQYTAEVHTNKESNGNNIEIIKEDENKVTQEESKEDQNTLHPKQTEETETNQLNVEYDLDIIRRRRKRERQDGSYVYREDTLRRRRRQSNTIVRPNARYRNGNVQFFMLNERPNEERTTERNEVQEHQVRRMPSR